VKISLILEGKEKKVRRRAMKVVGIFFLLLLAVTFLVQVVAYLNYKKHKKD